MSRTPVFAGNWKMHKTPDETRAFLDEFLDRVDPDPDRRILLFPPALAVPAAVAACAGRGDVEIGVQHIHWEELGAFTGEISAGMAAAAGARAALIGHSERRHLFGETIGETAKKVQAASRAGVLPILCVGETLDERRAGRAKEVVRQQLEPLLDCLRGDGISRDRVMVAYEPVWAIGTGETASPGDAQEMHAEVRALLDGVGAGQVPVLYGGSVKPENAAALLGGEDVDGVLVGGASLEPASFARICEAR
jgi:triosephosphate isomerase (TIM)